MLSKKLLIRNPFDRTTSFKSSVFKILLFSAGIFFAVIFLQVNTSFPEVVAIVNDHQEMTQISLGELRNIYMGKIKNLRNGNRIVLFLPQSKSVSMDTFVKKILRLQNESEVSKLYLRLIFRQVFSIPPIPVLDASDAVLKVTANPGGIAIVESSKLPPGSSVKIIKLVDLN